MPGSAGALVYSCGGAAPSTAPTQRGISSMSGLVQPVVRRLVESVGTVIIGKETEVEQCVLTLLCRGHLLIEDVPGVGKTLLAKSLARATGCQFERVQFTPDLLPSDVTGVNVFN